MERTYKILLILLVILALAFSTFFSVTPVGVKLWNKWHYQVQLSDDATNYDTFKKVEDTCRAMISSYESDKLTYEQYKDSDNKEKAGWAEQAKMRANSYNNYLL